MPIPTLSNESYFEDIEGEMLSMSDSETFQDLALTVGPFVLDFESVKMSADTNMLCGEVRELQMTEGTGTGFICSMFEDWCDLIPSGAIMAAIEDDDAHRFTDIRMVRYDSEGNPTRDIFNVHLTYQNYPNEGVFRLITLVNDRPWNGHQFRFNGTF
jgi:hypothetical protein